MPFLETLTDRPGCGAAPVRPRRNPYREEGVIGVLELRNADEGFIGWSALRRDEAGRIAGFDDEQTATERTDNPARPFSHWWGIPRNLRPHFLVNLKPALEALGRTRSRQYAEAVRMARIARAEGPWFPFVTLDFGGYSFIDPTLN